MSKMTFDSVLFGTLITVALGWLAVSSVSAGAMTAPGSTAPLVLQAGPAASQACAAPGSTAVRKG